MPPTLQQKENSRRAILNAAQETFKEKGLHGATIEEIMKRAGMTVGGFYAHFSSKEALIAEAMRTSIMQGHIEFDGQIHASEPRSWVGEFIDHYLSRDHLEKIASGCPMPALLSELGRCSDQVKRAVSEAGRTRVEKIAQHLEPNQPEEAMPQACSIMALCIGAVTLARVIPTEEEREEVLEACRRAAHQLTTPLPAST